MEETISRYFRMTGLKKDEERKGQSIIERERMGEEGM
jgi:hypothetical protein